MAGMTGDVALLLRRVGFGPTAAELTSAFKSIRVSNTGVDTGEVQELSVTTDRYQIFLSGITSEYYVLMVMSPDGNHGRARWELKRARHALQDELI